MSNKNGKERKTPKLRFPGFTGEWEERKLGEMGITYTGLSGKTREDFGHGDGRFVTYMNVFLNPISDLTKTETIEIDKAQNNVRYGDVFFTASSETPEEVGMSSVWLGNIENIYLNSFCFGYRPTVEIFPYYMAYMLRSEAVRRKIIYLAQGISRYNISKKSVMEIKVPVPDLAEQKKIGEYFRKVDHLIILQQNKMEHVKKLKKGLLQKMFPRKGEDMPELRIPGFSDAWEQRQFSDFAQRESLIQTSSYDCPSVEYEDVIVEEGCLNKDIRLKEVQKTGIKFDGAQVLYGKLRPYLHNWLKPDFMGVAVGDWWVLRPVEIDKNFLYRLIQTKKFDDVANQSSGSKMPRADWNLVSQSEFMVPTSLKEQCRIAEVFEGLDHLITLHQRKLDHLKQLKKGLLQQMFIM